MDEMGMEERGYRLTGRVQGVGFRWWTRKTAESLGVVGAVRNRRDGSVEIRARGAPASLDELRERLESGPSAARVDAVESLESDLPMTAGEFRIVR
jgi:acylphosphatase